MISVFLPVSFTAATKSGLSHALISPLRATYLACGAFSWISGISGPLGPCGTEAVVMTGSLHSVAILASAAARRRSSGIGMSPTVWNRPLWWSISSMAVSAGSMAGRLPLKLAGVDISLSPCTVGGDAVAAAPTPRNRPCGRSIGLGRWPR